LSFIGRSRSKGYRFANRPLTKYINEFKPWEFIIAEVGGKLRLIRIFGKGPDPEAGNQVRRQMVFHQYCSGA